MNKYENNSIGVCRGLSDLVQRFFRFRALPQVLALVDELRPDALMERYYNFGGEGVRAGAERGVPALLEVNSPVVDHPGSWKAALDALLLVRPLQRYREELCRKARLLPEPASDEDEE